MLRGLLLAFFFNDRFSNVKLDGNIRICGLRRRTDRTGENFVKLGVNFRGMGVHFIRGEVLPHCLKSVSRIAVGNLFNDRFSNVKLNVND